MKYRILLLVLVATSVCLGQQSGEKVLARQGQVTFFSYTAAENIEAVNNQALSVLVLDTGEIAVDILMRAFVFKKTLMREHFNESYIESDLYPKAKFRGQIIDFDPESTEITTRMVKGSFTLKDKTVPLSFKVRIQRLNDSVLISGDTQVNIDDYNIKIPKLLSPNIAKQIKISFNFEHTPYEE